MAIQSSINSLLSQAQSLAAFYKGFEKADKILGDQAITKNEAKIQTDIAAGNAPMKDGKVDPEWLQKRRNEFKSEMFDQAGNLSGHGKHQAQLLEFRTKRGIELSQENKEFYNNPKVQDYLKSFREERERIKSAALDSAIETQSTNSKLKNEVAGKVARASVEARTNSINQAKADFNAHTASLIKEYAKGSGNP